MPDATPTPGSPIPGDPNPAGGIAGNVVELSRHMMEALVVLAVEGSEQARGRFRHGVTLLTADTELTVLLVARMSDTLAQVLAFVGDTAEAIRGSVDLAKGDPDGVYREILAQSIEHAPNVMALITLTVEGIIGQPGSRDKLVDLLSFFAGGLAALIVRGHLKGWPGVTVIHVHGDDLSTIEPSIIESIAQHLRRNGGS